MSWDVFVQDFPDVGTLEEMPDDFEPKTIGKRQDVINKIKEVVPFADFSDPSWGVIDTEFFSIELNMGDEEDISSFAFHVRGGSGGGACVAQILKHLGLNAVDSATGDFFDFDNPEYGFKKWKKYRDKCIKGQ